MHAMLLKETWLTWLLSASDIYHTLLHFTVVHPPPSERKSHVEMETTAPVDECPRRWLA